MDPVTIGATVALLAAKKVASKLGEKAIDKAGEKLGEKAGEAGWDLGNRILDTVRNVFSFNQEGKAKLETVEEAAEPTDQQVNELAAAVTKQLESAPDAVEALAPMVEAAKVDPELRPLLATADSVAEHSIVINQSISGGGGNVQIGHAGGDVNVDTTGRPSGQG